MAFLIVRNYHCSPTNSLPQDEFSLEIEGPGGVLGISTGMGTLRINLYRVSLGVPTSVRWSPDKPF